MASTLKYSNEGTAGITRKRVRDYWAYHAPDGERIKDRDEIDRLNKIALPPAYVDCWYSADPDAHLLAFGFDARGRKQYRYHPDFRSSQEALKFELCPAFARALPKIRRRMSEDLSERGLTRERAIASIVALLDSGAIRIGNETYAKDNKSFGATTLRNRHAKIDHGKLRLHFTGKSGKTHDITYDDPKLVRVVKKMQDLPGQHLFQYLGEDGQPVPVHSHDVNEYIHETMGDQFTAKNFRTWTASAIAFGLIRENLDMGLKPMLLDVSGRLGNTPAIARKSYIHPAVIAVAQRDAAMTALMPDKLPRATEWLSAEERGLIEFMEKVSPGCA